MNLRKLAILSVNRRKGKRSFVLIAMALGCATVIILFSFVETQKKAVETQFDEYGANIVVLPKSDNLGLSYGGVDISGVVANQKEISLRDIERIWQIPNKDNIRAVSPKLIGAATVQTQRTRRDVLMIGVYFEEELRIKSWWQIDGAVPANNAELLVGSDVAEILQLQISDMISIDGKSFTVSGLLLSTGSQDDGVIFADFETVSSHLGKRGVVSLAEVSALCSDCPIEDITSQISASLPGANIKQVRQVMQQKMETIGQFERFAVTITGVILVICASLIFTSMMGSVADRKSEIGIFRAIGFKKLHISSIILTESFIISLISGILGAAAGYVISFAALPSLLGIERSAVVVSSTLIGISLPAVITLGLLASVYPAMKASRIDPVTAINSL